jgi:hypothetical protein
MPLDLVLAVSTNGTHYSIELIRGLLPRPPDEGHILTSIDKSKPKRNKLNLLDLLPWRRKPDILQPEPLPDALVRSGAISYVPRPCLSHRSARSRGAILPVAPAQVDEIVGTARWMSKLSAIFGLGCKSVNGAGTTKLQTGQSRIIESNYFEKDLRKSPVSAEAHYSYRMIARRRIHMANLPIRPGGAG